jgi:hypothetical protein
MTETSRYVQPKSSPIGVIARQGIHKDLPEAPPVTAQALVTMAALPANEA